MKARRTDSYVSTARADIAHGVKAAHDAARPTVDGVRRQVKAAFSPFAARESLTPADPEVTP